MDFENMRSLGIGPIDLICGYAPTFEGALRSTGRFYLHEMVMKTVTSIRAIVSFKTVRSLHYC